MLLRMRQSLTTEQWAKSTALLKQTLTRAQRPPGTYDDRRLRLASALGTIRLQQPQQRSHSVSRHRIHPIRRDLGQWLQHEQPVAKPEVRNVNIRLFDDLSPVQNQIDIERPRRTRIRPRTAVLTFHLKEPIKQVECRQRRAARGSGIEKPRLLRHANRVRIMECGNSKLRDRGRQIVQRPAQAALPIAQVAAQRQCNSSHRGYPNDPRNVGRAEPTPSSVLVRRRPGAQRRRYACPGHLPCPRPPARIRAGALATRRVSRRA